VSLYPKKGAPWRRVVRTVRIADREFYDELECGHREAHDVLSKKRRCRTCADPTFPGISIEPRKPQPPVVPADTVGEGGVPNTTNSCGPIVRPCTPLRRVARFPASGGSVTARSDFTAQRSHGGSRRAPEERLGKQPGAKVFGATRHALALPSVRCSTWLLVPVFVMGARVVHFLRKAMRRAAVAVPARGLLLAVAVVDAVAWSRRRDALRSRGRLLQTRPAVDVRPRRGEGVATSSTAAFTGSNLVDGRPGHGLNI
jgi:hypothetical protein